MEKKGYMGMWMRIFVRKNGGQAMKKKAGGLSGAAARTGILIENKKERSVNVY